MLLRLESKIFVVSAVDGPFQNWLLLREMEIHIYEVWLFKEEHERNIFQINRSKDIQYSWETGANIVWQQHIVINADLIERDKDQE